MIQRLGDFMHKWGNVVLIAVGVILIISSIGLQLRGVTEIEVYEQNRYKSAMPFFVISNYFVGGLFIILGIKRQWIIDIVKRIRKRKEEK